MLDLNKVKIFIENNIFFSMYNSFLLLGAGKCKKIFFYII